MGVTVDFKYDSNLSMDTEIPTFIGGCAPSELLASAQRFEVCRRTHGLENTCTPLTRGFSVCLGLGLGFEYSSFEIVDFRENSHPPGAILR